MTPFVSVENHVPNKKVTVSTRIHSRKIKSAPRIGFCGTTPPIQYPTAVTPPNMIVT